MKQRIFYLLLSFFLGMFGMNRFYVNKNKSGLLLFLSTVIGSILMTFEYVSYTSVSRWSYEVSFIGVIGIMLYLISLICACGYLLHCMTMTDEEFNQNYNEPTSNTKSTKAHMTAPNTATKTEASSPSMPIHYAFSDGFDIGRKVVDSRGVEWEIINFKEKTIECKSSQGVCVFSKDSVKLI